MGSDYRRYRLRPETGQTRQYSPNRYTAVPPAGAQKYERLEMPYPIVEDPSYSVEELDKLEAFFAQFDFDIRLVRH